MDPGKEVKTEVKDEEDICVRRNLPSMKEPEMMVTTTKEESSLYISTGGHDGWNISEGHLILPSDYNEDGGLACYSAEGLGTQYIHHRLDDLESSADSFIYEESNDKPDVQESCHS
ncbi:unnamed protein product, partial [Staurois parvus]